MDKDFVASDEDFSNKPKDDFTEASLIQAWTEFGKKLQKEGALNMFSIINANKPVLQNKNIVFALPNKLMEEQFGAVKAKLMHYLRENLNNYSIQLKTIVVASEKKKYVYTPQDKFKKLLETNPAIQILKSTFGLDI